MPFFSRVSPFFVPSVCPSAFYISSLTLQRLKTFCCCHGSSENVGACRKAAEETSAFEPALWLLRQDRLVPALILWAEEMRHQRGARAALLRGIFGRIMTPAGGYSAVASSVLGLNAGRAEGRHYAAAASPCLRVVLRENRASLFPSPFAGRASLNRLDGGAAYGSARLFLRRCSFSSSSLLLHF